MNRGYIKLWRKMFDSGMQKEHATFTLWIWILCNVTRKPLNYIARGQQIKLEPGELIVGRKKLSLELKLSERSIRTCLDHLEKWQNVTIRSTNRFSIIKVINWSIYQQTENENDQQNDQEVTSKRPASDHKTRSKNKRIVYSPEFESFWNEYPKHVKKGDAFKEWLRIDTSNGTVQKIMDGLRKWKLTRQWADDGGKYIPDPERFIKKRRWEDEIKTVFQEPLMPRN